MRRQQATLGLVVVAVAAVSYAAGTLRAQNRSLVLTAVGEHGAVVTEDGRQFGYNTETQTWEYRYTYTAARSRIVGIGELAGSREFYAICENGDYLATDPSTGDYAIMANIFTAAGGPAGDGPISDTNDHNLFPSIFAVTVQGNVYEGPAWRYLGNVTDDMVQVESSTWTGAKLLYRGGSRANSAPGAGVDQR